MSKGTRIAAAAIRLDDGGVFSLSPPARHHDIIRILRATGYAGAVSQQGFVTELGLFVGRKPAMRIAEEAGQVLRRTAPAHGLFSEDLW